MRAIVSPGRVEGSLVAPPSKSHFQRVCAAALLHRGTTTIHNGGKSTDDLAAFQIMQDLGAQVVAASDNWVKIQSDGVNPAQEEIHCGESGLSARLFTPIAALASKPVLITGSGSLLTRPMHEFKSSLPALGVRLDAADGTLPFTVQGPLKARSLTIDGSVSSQFASGLLFALSDAATEPITLTVQNAKSLPYLWMSQDVLHRIGRPIEEIETGVYRLDPALFTEEEEVTIVVEGDWSSASPLLVAACTTGEVTVQIEYNTLQADAVIMQLLEKVGAKLSWLKNDQLRIEKHELHALEHDCTDSPDLIPILSVLAAACEGTSRISGLHRLIHKESNRIETTSHMLLQAGIPFSIEDDTLIIEGPATPKSCIVSSYNDHRIAMSAAILALRADGPITVEGAEAIRKSYPDFFRNLQDLGVSVQMI